MERGLIDPDALIQASRAFRGVARRLDKTTTVPRTPAYEGFGSSYEKARSAIEAMRLHFPDRPLVVVFEPHTFSWRNQEGLGWYDSVFDGAARVLLLPPPEHGAASHHQLTQAEIAARIRGAGVDVTPLPTGQTVLDDMSANLTGKEAILLLSSGPLDGLADTLPPMLDTRFG